jgi:hypothetical protein
MALLPLTLLQYSHLLILRRPRSGRLEGRTTHMQISPC